MIESSQIREHMEVVSVNNEHLGKVDELIGSDIKLTKALGVGTHHLLPISLVASVDDKVHLSVSAEQAKKSWREAH